MSLDAIGLVCKNLEASQMFYKPLGLNFIAEGEGAHMEAQTPSGIRVMLDSEDLMKRINPEWEKKAGTTMTLGFVQESPNDVDSVVKALLENGGRLVKEPWDAFWGQRYATVLDPDGHQVDIFATLPNNLT